MPNLQDLITKLRDIKSFRGSIPDQWANTSFMKEADIKKELLKRYEQFFKLESLKGCGELTSNEKKELTWMKLYFKGESK